MDKWFLIAESRKLQRRHISSLSITRQYRRAFDVSEPFRQFLSLLCYGIQVSKWTAYVMLRESQFSKQIPKPNYICQIPNESPKPPYYQFIKQLIQRLRLKLKTKNNKVLNVYFRITKIYPDWQTYFFFTFVTSMDHSNVQRISA